MCERRRGSLPTNCEGWGTHNRGPLSNARRRIYEAGGTRRMSNRVTGRQIGHILARVTRAGAASGRPYGEQAKAAEISNFGFEI